ncbi:MAG: flagellin [Pseudomonadales bacterium]|nr:flagellin [Pseudomonadales bacterium]
MIVNTNLSALNAQRMLFENTKAASTVMERLATGSKINKAQDDVAGSAIADRMTTQVRGLNMAVKNANDALSLLDTADAIFIDQTNLTQRIRELALQAANNTNSIKDREYLQSEVTSLVAEMDRVPTQTTFNDAPVGGSKKFQIGADAGQSITTYISTHSGHSGTTYGQSTQDYSAGSTNIEVKGLSTSGPFAFGDMVIAGLPESGAYFVQGVSSALMHDDGTFTQTISLAGTGLNKSISADMEFVTAIGTIDLTLVDDPGTPQNEQFTLGGRGSLKRIDLVNNASGALSGIDSALQSLSNSRATVGASKNRINYLISNLMNISEQTTAARSRIEDADFATESAAFAKTQVLQQTATAMLAQANARPQLVLQLVK